MTELLLAVPQPLYKFELKCQDDECSQMFDEVAGQRSGASFHAHIVNEGAKLHTPKMFAF